jgi:hypothetical protein
MPRPTTWRFWAGISLAIVIYTVLGIFYRDDPRVLEDLFKWAFVPAAIVPVVGITVYTIIWRNWHENSLGANLAMTNLGLIPMCGILAFVFNLKNGQLGPGWTAWFEGGSPLWLAYFIAWRGWITTRIKLDKNKAEEDGEG